MKQDRPKGKKKQGDKEKKQEGFFSKLFCCCCSRTYEKDKKENKDEKYKEPEKEADSKLNLMQSPPPEAVSAEQVQDLDDLIDPQYAAKEMRKIDLLQFPFQLPIMRGYPVMQVYQHHLINAEKHQLIA